jgi:hypothetical protein
MSLFHGLAGHSRFGNPSQSPEQVARRAPAPRYAIVLIDDFSPEQMEHTNSTFFSRHDFLRSATVLLATAAIVHHLY